MVNVNITLLYFPIFNIVFLMINLSNIFFLIIISNH